MKTIMKMAVLSAVVVVPMLAAIGGSASANGRDFLARFDGGIGSQPVSGVAGPVNADGTFPNVARNIVRGIPAAGPWRVADLRADVEVDGRIRVRGRGLLLAAGNSIGTNANQRVFATLICEAAAPFVEHSTDLDGVALEPNGDFRIDDVVSLVPADCASPVLLIRSAQRSATGVVSGVWFAAGIPVPTAD